MMNKLRIGRTKKLISIQFWLFVLYCCISPADCKALSVNVEEETPEIIHFPVTMATAGEDVRLKVSLQSSGNSPVYVRIYYRSSSASSFKHVEMNGSFDSFEGRIPGASVTPPSVQYFILVLYRNRSIETLPEVNLYGRPFEVLVEAKEREGTKRDEKKMRQSRKKPNKKRNKSSLKKKISSRDTRSKSQRAAGSSKHYVILSPQPEELLTPEDLVIAASFSAKGIPVDATTVKLFVDDRDVTKLAKISNFLISFSPERISGGNHRIVIEASDQRGRKLEPLQWQFTVLQFDEDESIEEKSYQGRVFTEFRQDDIRSREHSAASIGGNISGTYKSFKYASRMYLTTLDDPRIQPINRFSFEAKSRILDVGLGDVYPYYNDLVLWGRRVRGISTALKFGFINFQFATGSTRKLIQPTYVDTTGVTTVAERGAFSQKLSAARISFGGGTHFQFGLIGLKVRDDESIDDVQTNDTKTSNPPQDNLVTGADLFTSLDGRRIELRGSVAFSLTTENITDGPDSKEDIESRYGVELPFDPASFESWIILNESTVPLDPSALTSLAYRVTLRLNYLRNNFQIGIKKYGSEYNSFGQSHLRNNLRGLFINDRINLANNQLFLVLGYENLTDNFTESDGNPKTDLQNLNVGISYYPGNNLPTVNLGFTNYLRQNNGFLSADSTFDNRENSANRNINLNILYNFNFLNLQQTATFTISDTRLNDNITRMNVAASQDVLTSIQMLSLKTQYNWPLTTTISYATNRNESMSGLSAIDYDSFSLRAGLRFFDDKFLLRGGYQYISGNGQSNNPNSTKLTKVDYVQSSFQVGAQYQPVNRHQFVLEATLFSYSDDGGVYDESTDAFTSKNPSFDNRLLRLIYEYTL